VWVVCVLGYVAVLLLQIPVPAGLSGVVSLAGMCAAGWLITHDLEKYGVPKKFPGVGFKVMLGLLILGWIFVGLGALISFLVT
jgi:hypothetical protein